MVSTVYIDITLKLCVENHTNKNNLTKCKFKVDPTGGLQYLKWIFCLSQPVYNKHNFDYTV